MSIPLLTTKCHIPPRHADLILRQRLFDQMNTGLHRKLILVSAPAGFGKTTMVVDWLANELSKSCAGRIAWLSLDENDNDLSRFLAYFIAALQMVEPGIGEDLRNALDSTQNLQIEILITLLVNEMADAQRKIVFVLDDFHLISSLQIHHAIQFLLEHQPPNLLLVIASRDEPFLPLSRLRARGEMIDIRAGDLRFSQQEAAQYLNQMMRLDLSDGDTRALAERTEGWITGLHLAAISMRGQGDPKRFISEFAGDDRYIIDYLVDEVLSHRSESSRAFLVRTSILNQLNAPLCAAVTRQADTQMTLQQLDQENVFIIALDNRRQWYRYHQLFADVLRQRLIESASSEEVKELHYRASRWFEENDSIIEAVEHMLKAEEYDQVIRLIDDGVEEMFLHSQLKTLLKWHDQLPYDLIDSDPKLCLIFAWAWVTTGQLGEAEHCLQAAENVLGTRLSDFLVFQERHEAMDVETQGALFEIAVIRAQLAIGRGDISEALNLTGFVLPYLEDDQSSYLYNPPIGSRMAAYFIQGLAQKLSGDLKSAENSFVEAAILGQKLAHVHIVALAQGHLANVQAIQGRLHQALETCQQGLREVQELAGDNSPLTGFLRAEFGHLLYEKNELEAAEQYLEEAVRVAMPWGFVDAFIPGLIGLMQINAARKNWQGAFGALDELEELGKNNSQLVKPIVDAHRALLCARQGKLDQTQAWSEIAGYEPDLKLPYSREDELIILSQILIAQKQWEKAEDLIEKLLEAGQAGERWGPVIKLLALKAILFQARGEQGRAVEIIYQALSLAGQEGYRRTFLDLGPPLKKMFQIPAIARMDYVRQLSADFEARTESTERPPAKTLIEPLSEREAEVLQLLATELTGPEIAQELVIAVSTLRTHTQQIYRKLGVKNRQGAIKEAQRLQIL